MALDAYVTIPIANLQLNTENPRYEGGELTQRDCIRKIAIQQGTKLVSLAKDIAARGFNPSKAVIVRRGKGRDQYVALDGNRRLAALKLLTSPGLVDTLDLPAGLASRYKKLHDTHKESLETQVRCVIQTVEEARHWMLIEHSGIKDGVATEDWDTASRHRFRGTTPALSVVDLVCEHDYIDERTKERRAELKLTNLERMLVGRDVPDHFGIHIENNKLVFLEPEDMAIAKLSVLVADLINTNKSVGDLYSKDKRLAYAEELMQRPLPTAKSPVSSAGKKVTATPGMAGSHKPKKLSTVRSTLIPTGLVLAINQPRINRIYTELQELKVDGVANSVAVLLRVFIELSMDYYAGKHKVKLKIAPKPRLCPNCNNAIGALERDMNLREKISAVSGDMVKKGIATSHELAGLKKFAQNGDLTYSVVSLNAYVHNRDLNPRPDELRTTWDDIQTAIEKLWSS